MAIQVWPLKEEVKTEGETWPPKSVKEQPEVSVTTEGEGKVEVSVGGEVVPRVEEEQPEVHEVLEDSIEEEKPRRGRPRKINV